MNGSNEESTWMDLAVSSIRMFADDGKLDGQEVGELLRMALSDGKIDDDERRVLKSIFNKATPDSVTRDGWEAIQRARKELDL